MWGTDRLCLYASISQEPFGVSAPGTASGSGPRLPGCVPSALPLLTQGMPKSQLKGPGRTGRSRPLTQPGSNPWSWIFLNYFQCFLLGKRIKHRCPGIFWLLLFSQQDRPVQARWRLVLLHINKRLDFVSHRKIQSQ